MAFIANWAVDKVKTTASGYLATGLKAGGTMAGNAVGGVGTLIENGGRSVGEGSKFSCSPCLASPPTPSTSRPSVKPDAD